MKKSVITCLMALLVICILPFAGCDDTKEGELPKLKTGDKWVSTITSEGTEYTMTFEVTGEENYDGTDCYTFEASINPPLLGMIETMTGKYDKSTMFTVTMQAWGEYLNVPFIVSSSYSYELPGELPYPLEVDKEIKVIETETTKTTSQGETETETEKNTYLYKVEKIEDITVPAGTFKCFKVVKYDETGNTALTTSWLSDETRQYEVKSIDHEDGTTTVLKSYSLK